METFALRKLLVQMSGAPGSGKTTTANLLAKAIDAFIVDHDVLKTFFLDIETPFGQAGKNAYRLQSMLTEELLKQGKNVIVDSTVNYQNTLDIGLVLAQRYGYTYKYVECRVSVEDIELLDERLRRRTPIRSQRTGIGRPPPDADTVGHDTDYHALFKKWIERPCRPADDDSVITVYSSISTPESCLAQILERMLPSSEAQISNGILSDPHIMSLMLIEALTFSCSPQWLRRFSPWSKWRRP